MEIVCWWTKTFKQFIVYPCLSDRKRKWIQVGPVYSEHGESEFRVNSKKICKQFNLSCVKLHASLHFGQTKDFPKASDDQNPAFRHVRSVEFRKGAGSQVLGSWNKEASMRFLLGWGSCCGSCDKLCKGTQCLYPICTLGYVLRVLRCIWFRWTPHRCCPSSHQPMKDESPRRICTPYWCVAPMKSATPHWHAPHWCATRMKYICLCTKSPVLFFFCADRQTGEHHRWF